MEIPRHYPPSHPLSHAYRQGMIPAPAASPYMPHNPYVSVRIDPTGIPYVDWGMVMEAIILLIGGVSTHVLMG